MRIPDRNISNNNKNDPQSEEGLGGKSGGWRRRPSSGEAPGAHCQSSLLALGVTSKEEAFRKQTSIKRVTLELHYPGFSLTPKLFPRNSVISYK